MLFVLTFKRWRRIAKIQFKLLNILYDPRNKSSEKRESGFLDGFIALFSVYDWTTWFDFYVDELVTRTMSSPARKPPLFKRILKSTWFMRRKGDQQ